MPKHRGTGWVKTLDLISNAETRKLELKFSKIDSNRAIASQPLEHLVHFSFAGFRLGQWKDDKWQSCTARETADYLARLLKEGIILNGVLYSFYGHSSSQLRSRACYLLRGSKNEVAELVESLGDFSGIKTVAKKAKRIGLLFSSCHALMEVPDGTYEVIDDIEFSGYNFTDGCGLVGAKTARVLSQKLSIISRNTRYHPAVYQIRFKGYKGVVMLEPQMPPQYWFQFRRSMRKFSGIEDRSFAVVEYSKPYTYGYLNDEVILLLHTLGVSAEVFLRKQKEHFQRLQESVTEPTVAFTFLCSLNRFDLAEKLVLHGIERVSGALRSLVADEHKKMLNKREDQKCRILVPESRLVFGVCDPRGVLQEGECFLRVTDDMNGGRPRTIVGCEVVVTRNPCLHPGDLRKLKAVDRPELSHLRDCIVFAVKGERPAADQMSGGDLDGDTFFVCWDPDLVPSTVSEAAHYPPGREPLAVEEITVDHRIEYFARYTSISLGRTKKLFLAWAILKGAFSVECQEINRLHSLCVDGNRIKIPDRLMNVPSPSKEVEDSFILNVLHREAEKESLQKLAARGAWNRYDSSEVVETILCQPRLCSEFRLVVLAYDWCRKNGKGQLLELLPYFNISALTAEQRHWLLKELPPTTAYPGLVMNGLLSSDILEPQELAPFHLDYPGMRWKRIFSTADRLANLFEIFGKSFPQFHRKLLVLQIQERLSVAIYIPQPVEMEKEAQVGVGVRVFAFPHTQQQSNVRGRVHFTSAGYRLYYDHTTFQLYDRQRANTFIWAGQPGNDDSSYRRVKGFANRARERQKSVVAGVNHDCVISIALDRFSREVKTQIGQVKRDGVAAAELYVISNTDLEAFQTLDLSLASMDTLETKPLFEKVPPPLTIARICTADWCSQPGEVRALIEAGDLSQLDKASVQCRILSILQFCFENNEVDFTGKIYQHYLGAPRAVAAWLAPEELLRDLAQGLIYAPGNVVFFAKLSPWEETLPSHLRQLLKAQIRHLLQSALRAANTIGGFAVGALRTILHEADSMSLASFRDLVEQACLLLSSPEQMLDICLEVFDGASELLLNESLPGREYFARSVFGVALDHSEEASEATAPHHDLWGFQPVSLSLNPPVLTSYRRIDAPQLERLAANDHVRFELARYPDNMFFVELPTFDALVESAQQGVVTFRLALVEKKQNSCVLYPLLVENKSPPEYLPLGPAYDFREDLNECQNRAVAAALTSRLSCIWGPPGTGKTQTVVAILQELLQRRPEERILVTAPTHNAVDNILKRYLSVAGSTGAIPLRISTNIRKVSSALMQYACDAMDRREFNFDPAARRRVLERIQQSRLIFTTCAGAGLGLLRNEQFHTVVIDESSQQTEPMSLIPLVKGSRQAILVGDHVQLRATVRNHAKAMGLEVSLFERLYMGGDTANDALSKVMLDIQYRMHPQICEFPSAEFYNGRLQAAASCQNNPLPPSNFPWPSLPSAGGGQVRCVFVPCLLKEDIGHRSKANAGQAQLCQRIYQLLTDSRSSTGAATMPIAILTPYTRQVKTLQASLPTSAIISTVDGFQGQEAEVIIYVTVRCNSHGDIGFLSDLRRLNVVLTRARAGLIVIGCPRTLTGGASSAPLHADLEWKMGLEGNKPNGHSLSVDQDSGPVWKRLVKSLVRVEIS
ncbi:hypothetical protein KXV52_004173 [Aspergillus fumigatus]|nr:hypothetical protein KXX41_000489 [Aspergillus fumigatus]KAH2153180.1 hypothetical protein KXW33_001713 [Aspergillus fumigatus]KAH2490968.1 hypothetical protein KXW70_005070 [Aspergillus fumigatus]KAH2760628.1 hypothetical protein KXV66_009403 [Aspergillus fumigatus]KAH3029651.1 hypothetical protein KXV73_002369 [Aspergillus fumigatus]